MAWLKQHSLAAYEVNDVTTGLRILRAGRVDFWLGGNLPTRFIVKNGDLTEFGLR